MSFLYPEFDRRRLLQGAGAAAAATAGLALGANAQPSPSGIPDVDFDDPETNLKALLKLRADISGGPVLAAFPGEAWAMVPGEGNYRLFKTFGIGASRLEERPEGWRIIHREVLYYLDPNTGEVLDEWTNPFHGRKVEVYHIANDPVNGTFLREGNSVLAAPYPYVAYGDDLIFRWNFFLFHKAVLTRKEYPLHAQSDWDQHCELWGIQGKISDVMNPDITSAPNTTSWSRVAQWIPFMEMGNRPGIMVYHSHTYKLTGGVQDLPRNILDYTEKNYPDYLTPPAEWVEPRFNESSFSNYKEYLDSKQDASAPAQEAPEDQSFEPQ